jgi:uncharacterized membrane protein
MFSWPYSHLLINHFPVVLSVVALGTSVLAVLLRRRAIWQAAMGALVIAGLFAYPVHFTGDKADRALGDPWYIKPGAIEAHDKAAGFAMWVILLVGAFAAYCWWRSLKRPQELIPAWVRLGVFVGAVAAVGTVTYTAYLGGKIVHDMPVIQLPHAPAGLPAGVAAPPRDSGLTH